MRTLNHKQRVFHIQIFSNLSRRSKKILSLMKPKKFNQFSKFHNQFDKQNENLFKTSNLQSKFKLKSNPKRKQLQTNRFKKRNF